MDWRIMSHVYVFLGQQGEDLKGDTGLVGQAHHGQTGHVFILCHTADVHFFHGFCNLLDFGAGLSGKAGEHLQLDAVALGHLHAAVVEHLGAQGGQLQHFIVRDLVQLGRALHAAGIGSEDAVHVGIDLAQIRVEHGRQGHRRSIRPPRPRVVISSYLLIPWKPVTMTMAFLSSSANTRSVSMRLMRASL